jgi:hypothetical protein
LSDERDTVEISVASIDFIPFDVITAEKITAEITNKLGREGLNIEEGDKAIMAGVRSGIQL